MKTKNMENYKLEELMREKYLPFSEKIFKKHFAPVKRKNVCDLKKINYIILNSPLEIFYLDSRLRGNDYAGLRF